MRLWLIKLLGGFTSRDIEKAESDAFDLIRSIEANTRFLQQQIVAKDEEIRRLTNLMLTRAAFIAPESKKVEGELPHAINKRQSWTQHQRELEKKDAKLARAAEADETERRWKDKPGAMPEGDSGNAANGS